MRRRALWALGAALAAAAAGAQHDHHAHHGHGDHAMTLDATGMVMGANAETLPRDCAELGPDVAFTVEAGAEFAAARPGTMFGYSRHAFEVPPCARITVTFVNRDEVRHQWMVHGLPRYLYAGGMFHLEAAGGQSQTGTFIVPGDDKTYLVHCDVAQHMEKGMKGQLKVGRGSGDLWSVPGVSGDFFADTYLPDAAPAALAAGAVSVALLAGVALRSRRKRSG